MEDDKSTNAWYQAMVDPLYTATRYILDCTTAPGYNVVTSRFFTEYVVLVLGPGLPLLPSI